MKREITLSIAALMVAVLMPASGAFGSAILGTGTGSLVGGDLTDPEDNGTAGGANYNATFFASNEAGFGGGEFAFNVFSNTLGGGGHKWCCGATGGSNSGQGNNQIVGAHSFDSIAGPIQLTRFTLSSSNDSPQRDPRGWAVQGSNDTTDGLDGTWTDIYVRADDGASDWTSRNQVISYSPGEGDTFLTDEGFTAFRLNTSSTGGGTSGAFHALSEVEFFGIEAVSETVPEPASIAIWTLLGLCLAGYAYRRRSK